MYVYVFKWALTAFTLLYNRHHCPSPELISFKIIFWYTAVLCVYLVFNKMGEG